jgi:SAM-dependent methyltransferase
MAGADRSRWDARHAAAVDVGPLPPGELRGREALLPASGRALDVACGRGAEAVWLAGTGLSVDAVDTSGVALDAAAELARRCGVSDAIRWWRHDLDDGLPAACTGPYDVVVCQRFRDPRLYPVLAGLLAPGGLLAVTVLSQVGDEPGRFRAPAGELRAAFSSLELLAGREAAGEAAVVARRPR